MLAVMASVDAVKVPVDWLIEEAAFTVRFFPPELPACKAASKVTDPPLVSVRCPAGARSGKSEDEKIVPRMRNPSMRGISIPNILKGIHQSMAGRYLRLLTSAGARGVVMVDVQGRVDFPAIQGIDLALDKGTEFIRFSGVVNPSTITTSNSVNSSQVADAPFPFFR